MECNHVCHCPILVVCSHSTVDAFFWQWVLTLRRWIPKKHYLLRALIFPILRVGKTVLNCCGFGLRSAPGCKTSPQTTVEITLLWLTPSDRPLGSATTEHKPYPLNVQIENARELYQQQIGADPVSSRCLIQRLEKNSVRDT